MKPRAPISQKIPGLRQRARADGSWRIWWEPNAGARALGFEPVELSADKLSWSVRRATELNEDVARKRAGETKTPVTSTGRTLAALIHAYQRDPEFTDKKLKTQASYARNLRLIEAKWGSYPVTSFTKPVMREWYVTNRAARGETQAVALIRMMSILFSFAELKGWRAEDSNPCFRIKMKVPKPRRRIATWDELDAILDAATTCGLRSIGTAVLLSALQGQRQTDVIEATCGDFRQVTIPLGRAQQTVWAWQVDRSKRGTLGLMQLHPLVLDRIEARLADADKDARLLIEERTGQGYSEDLFWSRWGEVRAAAATHCRSLDGRDPLQFRDLRRTFAVWSRAGGATDDDVGDVLGNTAALDPRLQDTYMPASFATSSRAVLSIERPKKRKEA
ncbi:hypothetical protein SAMN05444007_108220 [Cribrihabitans marinus]|uniref:Core-binding (CB) domain-containing protein n=1 Tax=Cribrihabitans marinus TaxID=1227549 RepID=A0A1H7CMW9_9RHOB|nr:hypothetical protein [Cribrihabitans marinus]GGH36109.1 hypothetical protein GCM10010973_29880 [Cribrihabitans marinus]SEJ91048.1 hypothetical protein SAMN05444007_108220 [Cribrihabitans marinus]